MQDPHNLVADAIFTNAWDNRSFFGQSICEAPILDPHDANQAWSVKVVIEAI